ncbi:IS200/IS605 family element transposase accessory protein TnpB [Blautia wexlerae]|uniref:RNA-guided endonuclease TnpB family protein n=1 Tax=Blautia wexlerae TaxID=418240 RepID=UPI00156D93FD|nr:RNA-guided endonuclease TnpB family protein [Blautia wexlerae]MDB6436871.1 transposase [Blautia wexlerae]NSD29281.1 IS200/IS605 family element transposase accessory protein TnpB [Blautia wexlerae]NSF46610.1 IS200/IS605 family element transposase accessory protein TnpB [Blautia wexlerae]NSF70588.1 IS200/IS605 family element transposase accessory protein TnpB [Blautia wexlerae]
MEQITITAKVQIAATDTDKVLLNKTMSVYCDACNYVSDYVFRTHDLKQFSLNKILYSTLREKFSLKSQMAQSVFKTVIARYKTILENQNEWIKPSFKKPQYDLVWNRDYSLTQNCFSVNTLNGRVKLPYFAEGMSKYFNHSIYKFGTAKLVNKHGKYYLHIPVTYEVEESNISDICNVVGIDRGINFVVATYDSKHKSGFVSGKAIKQKRANYSRLRKELQMRHTPSSRRRLKAIGQRENRWMQDINHQVSKALATGNPKHTLFVLEDLTGICNVTERVKTKNRYVSVSWSFYDLEQKLIYKAKQNQSSVIKVDPRYTSQCCPACGHTEKSNRNKKIHLFTCKNCGYTSNDDRIGAMNLYRMGINYLADSQVPNTVVTE